MMKSVIKYLIIFLLVVAVVPAVSNAATLKSHYLVQIASGENLSEQEWFEKGSWELIDSFTIESQNFATIKGPLNQLQFLNENPSILKAETDQTVSSFSTPQAKSWGVSSSKADRLFRKGCSCKIAIIDTGISDHVDLKGRVSAKMTFLYDTEIKKEANDDSVRQHGTHVAGIIAANNNRFGTVGIDPTAKLLIAKVLDDQGEGYLSDVSKGIAWSIENGAQVINLSLGLKTESTILNSILKSAYDKGVVVVAAAGNGSGKVYYPASSPYTIAVGAIDKNGNMPSWSNYDSTLDLLAPGVSIPSTIYENQYDLLDGTSMAAPHVSATAGKLLTKYKGPANSQRVEWVRSRMKANSVQKKIDIKKEKQTVLILNAYKSYYGK